ncbi:MAG: phytoene/squalene synthase family protein [Deltaproteobacteria bacterium]|nr:phytoene/squalene synthase family protein [Deltaproteobacteria bacterium]
MAAPVRSEEERRADVRACHAILERGSKSFVAASRMLPKRLRDRTAALYAFCRVADDAVDLTTDARQGLARLHERLDRIYAGGPDPDPVDRAFCDLVHELAIPKPIPAALLEGFAWDAERRRYADAPELEAYCARVASTVGVMMTLIFGERSPALLARACDLGLAMQLTNICRDVGEDARAGRVYLPLEWLAEAGLDPDGLVARPEPSPALASVVKRTLALADEFYRRADGGMALYPRDCRLGIRAARLIYAEIGRVIARNGYDSVTIRAYTGKARKLLLLGRALTVLLWPGRPSDAPPAPAVKFLVDAVAQP